MKTRILIGFTATLVLTAAVLVAALLAPPADAAGKPGKPTNLAAIADDHETVSLSWTAPSSDPTPDQYRIFRRNMDEPNGSLTRIATSDTTSYTDNDVSADTDYRYRVAAVADGKTGRKSAKADVSTPEDSASTTNSADSAAVPNRPLSLELSEATAGSVVATWAAPRDGADPTGYKVSRTHVSEGTTVALATLDSSTFSYADSTVAEETWYSYYVAATNDAGEGPANGPDSIKTKNQTPGVPEEITSLSVSEETAGQVVVSWTAATDGPAATGFKVYRERLSAGGVQGVVHIGTAEGASATSYTDSSTEPGLSYQYHVRPKNDAGHAGAWRRALITTKTGS